MMPDDVSFQIRADNTIELSNGRVVTPIRVLRNIHREPERMPIVAVERIGRRLSVTTERIKRRKPVWLSQAFPLSAENHGRWAGFSAETIPGTLVTIAGDDQKLFRLPDGIATFPNLQAFDVLQVDNEHFVASCTPHSRLAGDNVWGYDRTGRLLWRVGHHPSLPQNVRYKYDYGIAIVRGEPWALSDKSVGVKIDFRTGDILEMGTPALD